MQTFSGKLSIINMLVFKVEIDINIIYVKNLFFNSDLNLYNFNSDLNLYNLDLNFLFYMKNSLFNLLINNQL